MVMKQPKKSGPHISYSRPRLQLMLSTHSCFNANTLLHLASTCFSVSVFIFYGSRQSSSASQHGAHSSSCSKKHTRHSVGPAASLWYLRLRALFVSALIFLLCCAQTAPPGCCCTLAGLMMRSLHTIGGSGHAGAWGRYQTVRVGQGRLIA